MSGCTFCLCVCGVSGVAPASLYTHLLRPSFSPATQPAPCITYLFVVDER